MSGKRGMKMPAKSNTIRHMLWSAMRIHRNFTIPDLIRSVPGGCSYENAQKFVRNLVNARYVATGDFAGGRSGEYRKYRLINDSGPLVPVLAIGRAARQLKNPSVLLGDQTEAETQKETETEIKTEGGSHES